MILPIYQVDAFSAQIFGGNPAAVIPCERWLPDMRMQQIAQENNLSETAFIVANGDIFEIRWFTPVVEVALCGHATLAAAKVIFDHLEYEGDLIHFESKHAGKLSVKRLSDDRLSLNFPSQQTEKYSGSEEWVEALNIKPKEILSAGDDLLLVYANAGEIRSLSPDFRKLGQHPVRGVIATAPGEEVDFVSRFFAPAVGVDEDPVTGSAHTKLIPFWSQRLSKQKLTATQLSKRGGSLWCEDKGKRVYIGGFATLYMKGEIDI